MKDTARSLVADILAGAGAGCLSAGAWWIYRPAGLLVAGVLLLLASGRIQSEIDAFRGERRPGVT